MVWAKIPRWFTAKGYTDRQPLVFDGSNNNNNSIVVIIIVIIIIIPIIIITIITNMSFIWYPVLIN